MEIRPRPGAIVVLVVCALAAPGGAPAAPAQDVALIDNFGAWSAFAGKEGGKRVCYVGSVPKKEEGPYKVRGDTLVLVTHRPDDGTLNVVSVQAGYTYQPGSWAEMSIDGASFELFTKAGHAWARDAYTDKVLTKAMKAGRTMVVRGTSSRGTKTKDTYSLSGFTAAYHAIGKACGVK